MNPYLIIAMLVGVLAAGAGGFKLGADHEVAAQAREQNHIAEAVDAANSTAAEAIAAIKPIYTTIQGKTIYETSNNTVYRDCAHSPTGLQLVNQALNGGAVAPDSGKLPKPEPAK
tara:strand:- start:991 stop:1335 length:345 start_codon:yes stop_codon:yes gene_type:complete